ncbi:hypothetical protein CPB86DRAFT_353254 [Serendipita vermifera]|nr:hypothetical protein CPB86DRAFT_353254 [Serendipita vermifera]
MHFQPYPHTTLHNHQYHPDNTRFYRICSDFGLVASPVEESDFYEGQFEDHPSDTSWMAPYEPQDAYFVPRAKSEAFPSGIASRITGDEGHLAKTSQDDLESRFQARSNALCIDSKLNTSISSRFSASHDWFEVFRPLTDATLCKKWTLQPLQGYTHGYSGRKQWIIAWKNSLDDQRDFPMLPSQATLGPQPWAVFGLASEPFREPKSTRNHQLDVYVHYSHDFAATELAETLLYLIEATPLRRTSSVSSELARMNPSKLIKLEDNPLFKMYRASRSSGHRPTPEFQAVNPDYGQGCHSRELFSSLLLFKKGGKGTQTPKKHPQTPTNPMNDAKASKTR